MPMIEDREPEAAGARACTGPIGMPLVSATVEIEIASEEDREGPDDVEEARQDLVDDAAEEAGDERDDRREEAAERRRDRADEQRVAAAVEQARGDVAALVVGAQEVVVDVPGRPDRRDAEAEAAGALHHHRLLLAVDQRRAVDASSRTGACARRGARTSRAARHDDHDHDEARERDERDPVAQQARGARAPMGCGRRRGPAWPTSPAASDLRHPRVARTSRHLLDPDLVHEHVELRAPDVVADALRDEVDQARVEEHGLRGVVRGLACRPSPTA